MTNPKLCPIRPLEPDTLIPAPKLKPVARKISVACNFCRCMYPPLFSKSGPDWPASSLSPACARRSEQHHSLTSFLARKLKCDGGKPQCQQCIRRKVVCEYDTNVKRRGLARSTQIPDEVQGIDVRDRPLVNPKAVACQFCRSKHTHEFPRYTSNTLWMITDYPPTLTLSDTGRKTKCDGRLPRCGNCEKRDQACSYNYGGHSPEAEAGPAAVSPSTTTTMTAAAAASAGGALPPIHSLQTATPGVTASGSSGSTGPPETLYIHYPPGSHPQQLPPPHGTAHPSVPIAEMPPPPPGGASGASRGPAVTQPSHRLPSIVDQPRRTSGDSTGTHGHGHGRTGSTASSSIPRLSPPTTPGTPGGLKRKLHDRDEEDTAIGATGLIRAASGSAKRKRTLEGSGHGAPQAPPAAAVTSAAGETSFQVERRGSDESRSSRPSTGSSRASVANLVEEGGVGGVSKPPSNPSSNGTSSTPTPGRPGK